MDWFVVLRHQYFKKYPARPLKEISRFGRMNGNMWWYFAKDIDNKENALGYLQVLKREDVARRCFEGSKGIDGKNSSVFLIYASAMFKSTAARKALGCLIFNSYRKGEVVELYVHDED